MSISADGCVAGPGQCEEQPLGVGGGLWWALHLDRRRSLVRTAGDRSRAGRRSISKSVGKPALELVRVLEAQGVAHVRYRVLR